MGIPSPAIPSFTDGTVVHQADLNALASNLTNLYNYKNAGFTTQPPCLIVAQTTGQTINNNTDTLINFGSASINTDNMWTPSTANTVTIQHGGIYWIFCQSVWPGIGGGSLANTLSTSILANGTSIGNSISAGSMAMISSGHVHSQAGVLVNLAAGATVYLSLFQNSGANQTLQTDGGSTFLGAFFVGPST